MPRIDLNRSTPIAYRPGFSPNQEGSVQGLSREVWVELERIAMSLAALDSPMGLAKFSSKVIPITVAPAVTWSNLFDAAGQTGWANPSGSLAANGLYTIPSEGIWSIRFGFSNPPFPAPGLRSYAGGLKLIVIHVDGSPTTSLEWWNGGSDDVPMSVSASYLYPMKQGDILLCQGAVQHATITGNTTVNAQWEIQRVSGLGNNTL